MIHVVDIKNPFDMYDGHQYHKVESASSVWDLLGKIGWKTMDYPITVTIGNSELPEEQWDEPIPDESYIGVAPKVAGGSLIIAIISTVIAVISIVLALSVEPPGVVQTTEADPVFSLKGQTNQTKLNEAIEALYGSVRHWPSYAASPYNKYLSQDSWQYSLLCLGHGEVEIDQVFIEDTPVEDYTDVTFEVYGPGEDVTLFRDNVETSSEVGAVELYGPNEDSYPLPDGWFTVVANSANTLADVLEFDVTLPRGLYRQSRKGKVKSWTVTLEFQYIEIDNQGVEVGSWQTLQNISKTKNTVNQLRYSYSTAVPPARYKVRGRRTNDASDGATVGDTVVWESLRAYLPNVGTYGDVTVMAVAARASDNLNDQSRSRFNFRGTRKLPIWDASTGWSEPVVTRNPVWAFCDIFRAEYGPALADKYLNLETLALVAVELEADGKWFDWVYDSSQTVWEAARTCASSFRAIPLLDGSQVRVQQDKPKNVVQHLFNAENIIEGSFSLETSLPKNEDYDGISMEYTDTDTWKVETVDCILPGSGGTNLETVTLAGVTDRDRAYREGMYQLSVKKKQRQQVTFKTGVEGFIATHSDLIKVRHDTFGIVGAHGGSITAISSDRLTLQIGKPISMEGGENLVLIRGKDGTPYGPYLVTAGETSDTLVSDTPVSEEIVFGDTTIDPLFVLGRASAFSQDCSITELRPYDDDTVEVIAIVYVPEVYDYDSSSAPSAGDQGTPIEDAPLPVVLGVDAVLLSGDTYSITWAGAPSAKHYVVEISADDLDEGDPDKDWQKVGSTQTTSFETVLLTEFLYVRVAGVNTGQGPWAYYSQFLEGPARITPSGAYRVTPSGQKRVIRTV